MKQILFLRSTDDLDPYIVDLLEQVDDQCILERQMMEIGQLQNLSSLSIIHLASLFKLQSETFDVQAFLNQKREVPIFLLMSLSELSKDWVLGEKVLLLDQTQPSHFHLPLLKMILSQQKENSQTAIGQGLDNLVAQSLRELQRVKKLHESLVPLRLEKLKSITLASKFAAGEASGGEFYDVIRSERQIILLISHTNSYLITSLILSHFEALKSDQNLSKESLEQFIKSLSKECRQIDNDKKSEVQLFILKIDLNSLKTEGYVFGQTQMVSNVKGTPHSNSFPFDPAFCEQAYFTHKLERGQTYCLLSPGVLKNSRGLLDGTDCARFVLEKFESGHAHILNEVFYQLKRGRDEMFLDFDATAIIIEVDSNVIVQI
jgi:hypothetical protein